MKANRPVPFAASTACAVLALLLCSCVEPVRSPVALAPPIRHVPSPPIAPALPTDWHDMPATPGVWHWSREGGKSVARFRGLQDEALLSLSCVRADGNNQGLILLSRTGQVGVAITMSIKTTSQSRVLSLGPGTITAILRSPDPLLDAMAFSRGRFAVEVPGLPALYVPSWPEVGRVIEDCRG